MQCGSEIKGNLSPLILAAS